MRVAASTESHKVRKNGREKDVSVARVAQAAVDVENERTGMLAEGLTEEEGKAEVRRKKWEGGGVLKCQKKAATRHPTLQSDLRVPNANSGACTIKTFPFVHTTSRPPHTHKTLLSSSLSPRQSLTHCTELCSRKDCFSPFLSAQWD